MIFSVLRKVAHGSNAMGCGHETCRGLRSKGGEQPRSRQLSWIVRMREMCSKSAVPLSPRGIRQNDAGRPGQRDRESGRGLHSPGMFEEARIAAWHYDMASDRFTWSGELLSILSTDHCSFDGTSRALEAIMHPDDRAAWRRAHEDARTHGNRMETEFRLIAPDSQVRWLLSRGEFIRPVDGRPVESYGVMIDITARKAAEQAAAQRAAIVGNSHMDAERRFGHSAAAMLRENEARLRLALKSARAGAWDFDLRRRELHWSPEMFALYGLDPAMGPPTREMLARRIAPAHRKRARKEFMRAMLKGGSFTLEFPIIRPDGTEIWTALAGDVIKDERGRAISARGIDQDITERKSWEKRQAMLLRELSHRVKNTLAVVQSIARQTLRSSASMESFAEAFEGRIRSLAASHTLLTEANWAGAPLETVIRHQVAALVEDYQESIHLTGPDVLLSVEAATQLGLVLHELATNAAKFGALSVPDGHVDILWTATKTRLRLLWREQGGPRIEGEPEASGFGSVLIASSAIKASQRFRPQGLVCKLEFAL